ncbi:DsbA family protein [Mariprofundus ferrooxydans]|uniref:DsbA family protein n=1 Tax=Mariprofundus ferrooxydans TaxID=314344 RepID=UPI0014303E58|nr:DsbA family protein [Mariprofundus ferrooxydans]
MPHISHYVIILWLIIGASVGAMDLLYPDRCYYQPMINDGKPVDKQSGVCLYYIHDPMCSWCWAFQPAWKALRSLLPGSIPVRYLLGGLAPDSDAPMPEAMQQTIRAHWRRIEQVVPGTLFNYDFWEQCTPRRSTWPACRAVIAARAQDAQAEEGMIRRIGEAYYRDARNPSDDGVLIDCALAMGLDGERFRHDLHAPETRLQLAAETELARKMGVTGFPSLILERDSGLMPVPVDYRDAGTMLAAILRG